MKNLIHKLSSTERTYEIQRYKFYLKSEYKTYKISSEELLELTYM